MGQLVARQKWPWRHLRILPLPELSLMTEKTSECEAELENWLACGEVEPDSVTQLIGEHLHFLVPFFLWRSFSGP